MAFQTCMIDGCDKKTIARGLCSTHYQRAKYHGQLDDIAPNPSGPCEHCGGEVIRTGRRWGARYCSTACKQASQDAVTKTKRAEARLARITRCTWCHEALPPTLRADARFCTRKCADDWNNRQKAIVKRRSVLAARQPCEVCGAPIPESRHGHAIYCSTACKSDAARSGGKKARERQFDDNLRRIYDGVTAEDYQRMMADQDGRCAICGTDKPAGRGKRLHVDHCHAGGQVRGLLCVNCNNGLGNFVDDPARLLAAISYLEKWGRDAEDQRPHRVDRSHR